MMRPCLFVVLIASVIAWRAVPAARQESADVAPKFAFAEPGISPDGREIAFASGGDIWSVAATGGEARLLVAHDATDRRPLFSPDGRSLAFISTRTGGGDIYVLTFATGAVRRLTMDDGLEQLDGWSRDGHWIYFSSTSRDIAAMNDIFRVPIEGGTPMAVTEDRYVNEFEAAPSPDGRRLAFVARGIASGQWWRRGSSHLDQSELWTVDLAASGAGGPILPPVYTEITRRDARQVWPMWSGDGRALFYVSDRGGAENVWTRPASPEGHDRQVTAFRDGRVLWPTITTDGQTIAFERNFGVWTLDTASGQTREVPITRRGASTSPAPERMRQVGQFRDLALAPDGKKVAFVARGDVFAASAKDGGDAMRVTATADLESQPAWAPDSRRLAYVSARGLGQQVYLYDFGTAKETALTSGSATDISPVFSPDGTRLAFLRDRHELRVLDLAAGAERVLATGTFADTGDTPRPVWSPDGKWIALFAIGAKAFANVELVSIDGGVPRPVSFLANVNANTIAWSPDGTYVLFDTGQRTEAAHLARVDLTLRTPKFREDLFRDLFSEPAKPAAPPGPPSSPASPEPATTSREPRAANPTPIFDDIRRRLTLLPVGLDVTDVVISPDGKTTAMIATSAGQTNLYSYSLDELSTERPVARQLTTTSGPKADPRFSPDSKELYYLEGGRINIVSLDRREARPLSVTAEFTVAFGREKLEVFRQAWTLLRDNFFDASFNGVDWQAARAAYEPRVAAAGTPDEMRRIMSLMIGDLNASHMGISGPGGGPPAIGRLGLRFAAREYEASGRLRVTDVIPLGPAALTRDLKVGDYLLAVDGRPTGARVNLDELLANTIDRRVVVTVASAASGPTRDIVIRPTNQATEKGLLYRQWVENNREYVLKASGGRLGYVHMINMSAAALDQLYIDLDADNHARDGVVIDIRNNSGGFVNAYAIDVFTRQPYLRMSTRILPEAPARTLLGQRALELATVLVTNQHSLSDAEDFSEGYRTLKLGPIVGEPTAGWIIYTSDTALVDGSTLRLPSVRVKAADGTDMERHPRPVDVQVTRPVGETLTGKDSQLDEAIRVLLKRLGRAE